MDDRSGPPVAGDRDAELRALLGNRRRNGVLAIVAVVVALAGAVIVLAARGGDSPPELRSIDAVAGPARAGRNLSAYLTIVNDGGSDSLTAASSPLAERVVLHTTEVDDGLTTMRPRGHYEIEGEATTIFRPGGVHLMFEDVQRDVEVGDELELTLRFAQSGTQSVSVRVVPMAEVVERLEPSG